MNSADKTDIYQRYNAEFGNIDELAAAELIPDPRFEALLESALSNGRKLSREDVDRVIPGVSWNY